MKKKTNHQKKRLIERVGRKRKLLIVCCLIIVLLFTALFATWMGRREDAARFSEAAKKKDVVTSELVKAINSPSIQDKADVCFNSEQGPYDSGKLWCQAATAVYFTNDVSENTVRMELEKILQASGLLKHEAGLDFTGAKNMRCRIGLLTGRAAIHPGYFLEDNEEAKLTVAIACADRAKAKHYPYVD